MHYGIKGMKWGVRRYQNKDGTLTKKGKTEARKAFQTELILNNSQNPSRNKRTLKVMDKYDRYRTDTQRQATQQYRKAWEDYQKYVRDYSKNHEDTQIRYEHDYDHTKKGKKLLNGILDSEEVMEKAYSGEKWFWKYAKELDKAHFKDLYDRK